MRIKIFQFFAFVLIIISLDLILGKVLKKIYFKKPSYTNAKIAYTIDSASQAILIYGSSRAQHHYIPDTITKYTKLSCYNCGIGGQGLVFSYIQVSEMLKRHRPKVIILDISPNILLDSNSIEKLRILMPYYERGDQIQNIFNSLSYFERFKYYSFIYPYNGSILSIISSFVYHKKELNKGFIPLLGKLNQKSISVNDTRCAKINNIQLNYLDSIQKICKDGNVTLIFMVSPIYKKTYSDSTILSQIGNISKNYKNYFLDYSSDSLFYRNSNLFKDNLHLNVDGAALYSKIISNDLFLISR